MSSFLLTLEGPRVKLESSAKVEVPWGCGLRPHHYASWQSKVERPAFLEVLTDNYLMQKGGPGLGHVRRLAATCAVVLHGVGMDVCGTDPLSGDYLKSLKQLVDEFKPQVVSDHLCFTRAGSHQSYDLLPFPYNANTLKHVASRVQKIQEVLGRSLALENVSSYVAFKNSDRSEFEFLNELCKRTGCGILLDVNNLYVNSMNFEFDPFQELAVVAPEHVVQYHVAGHTEGDGFLHDTHDRPVKNEVWKLLRTALSTHGVHPVVVERDDEQVSLEDVLHEIQEGKTHVLA